VDIRILALPSPALAALPVEIVERKGIGHPDTLCDALAEQLSLALSRWYLERFGFILHHNVDKGLLWGGAARPAFGGGAVLEPIEIYLCGRATRSYRGVTVPLEELAVDGSRAWLRAHLHALDVERHVRIHCLVRPSSAELGELFRRGQEGGVPLANDTSIGVGYAPLSALERVVLAVERDLNSTPVKAAAPQIGEDIKVMGVRRDEALELTVACALVDRHVRDLAEYRAHKARIAELARTAARDAGHPLAAVAVNSADGDTPGSIYLTVTGTSAEAGDDGQVGRGNRVNGLITPYRPMSLEASAGKNPVTHVGKLYNVLARRIAEAALAVPGGVEEAHCWLVSRIGAPITEPQVVDLKLRLAPGARLAELEAPLRAIAREQLAAAPQLWRELVPAGPAMA
jgi:S-adenosylmethionine synthetase